MIIIDIQILSTANANISIIIGKTTANPIVSVICTRVQLNFMVIIGGKWRKNINIRMPDNVKYADTGIEYVCGCLYYLYSRWIKRAAASSSSSSPASPFSGVAATATTCHPCKSSVQYFINHKLLSVWLIRINYTLEGVEKKVVHGY